MFMKKLYVFMTALLALFAINANAIRVLYSENYEAGGVPSTWTFNGDVNKVKLGIVSTAASSILQWTGGSDNGRSAHDFWGTSIFEGVTEKSYSLSFEIRFDAQGNNQYNGEVAIFADEDKCQNTNGNGGGQWLPYSKLPNCLFSLTQNSATAASACDTDHTHWFVNNDSTKVFIPNTGNSATWYLVTLNVNTETKQVEYDVFNYDTSKSEVKGVKTMSDEDKLFATGLYLMCARYQSVFSLDNLQISLDIEYANQPVIALTGLKDSERTYMITFLEGETLHVKGTDGQEQTVSYDDVEEGNFFYKTTTSGTLTAWTTAGTMKSEETTVEVDCSPVVLPIPTYAVVSASKGYAKTYQFTIDNKLVPLQPTIYMDFVFEGEGGQGSFTLENQTSGARVEVPGKGTLKITTKALGYASSTSSIVNDIEYEIKHDIDFQHMTAADLAEKGFTAMEALSAASTSGETNWTGRLRMYFSIDSGEKDDQKNPIYTYYPVYGYNAQTPNITQETLDGAKANLNLTPTSLAVTEHIQRCYLASSKVTEVAAHNLFAPVYTWNTTSDGSDVAAIKFNIGIGLINAGAKGDETGAGGTSYATATLGVDGLAETDLIVVSKITDYGNGSQHPQFPVGTNPEEAKAQYKAMDLGLTEVIKGNETFTLNRIDAALTRVLVLSPKNGTGIDNMNYNKVVSDANAPVYNLNGVKMNPNALTKGIYVKQGKKFVVK